MLCASVLPFFQDPRDELPVAFDLLANFHRPGRKIMHKQLQNLIVRHMNVQPLLEDLPASPANV